MVNTMNVEERMADQYEALASLDKEKIERFCQKYEIAMPVDDDEWWSRVHHARTILPGLPRAERIKSNVWLSEHGHRFMLTPWWLNN